MRKLLIVGTAAVLALGVGVLAGRWDSERLDVCALVVPSAPAPPRGEDVQGRVDYEVAVARRTADPVVVACGARAPSRR